MLLPYLYDLLFDRYECNKYRKSIEKNEKKKREAKARGNGRNNGMLTENTING